MPAAWSARPAVALKTMAARGRRTPPYHCQPARDGEADVFAMGAIDECAPRGHHLQADELVAHRERRAKGVHPVDDGRAGPFGDAGKGDRPRLPLLPLGPMSTLQSMPLSRRGPRTPVKTRLAASQASCALKTLPTPVSGQPRDRSGLICTGTAARSGVRSRNLNSISLGKSGQGPLLALLRHADCIKQCPSRAAGSTGRRNTGVKSLCRGLKLQGLTWSFVELTSHFVQIGLRVHRQVGALRKVLSQQAIGVLVRPALPRALRIAKIDVDVGRQRKATMSRQFLAPVPGQGLIQLLW